MDSMVKKFSRDIVPLILALTLAVFFYVRPLNGEMCSTMTSASDGENFAALQKRAFSSFRSTCRRESPEQNCGQLTRRFNIMELQMPMTSPVRLEFNVTFGTFIGVHFTPVGPDAVQFLVELGMYHGYAFIATKETPFHKRVVQPIYSIEDYVGVPIIVTYDNGRFEVAIRGVPDSTYAYDAQFPSQPSLFILFFSSTETELNFTDPSCINDFNPKYTKFGV
ncbi:uncharacterized protein [Asterias amurensis]|uniref:uncharacterized protein n=1 Tax=Asterias amurensis TaxID=7602 RepID=UPI003AB13709